PTFAFAIARTARSAGCIDDGGFFDHQAPARPEWLPTPVGLFAGRGQKTEWPLQPGWRGAVPRKAAREDVRAGLDRRFCGGVRLDDGGDADQRLLGGQSVFLDAGLDVPGGTNAVSGLCQERAAGDFYAATGLDGRGSAVVEELYFRGYLLPRLSRCDKWAPLLGGLFFGLYHVWQLFGLPTVFLIGAALGYVVWWKRDVRIGIGLHVLANTLGRLMFLMAALAM
ncbi:MAG: CPBP family intramembrane metalloprotease, partial [Planctomycetes bacterium]|nr:CPBP family intramembrane metalloprotease [Planctomycetota bacterium]